MTNTKSNEDAIVVTSHPFEGLDNGEERLAKVQLAQQINVRITERGLTQNAASRLLGISQPDVSQIANGRLSGFFHSTACIVAYMHLIWISRLLLKDMFRQTMKQPEYMLASDI